MEEFDINGDSEIGTSVSKLKNNNVHENFINTNDNNVNLRHTDTDIDYDKIIENLNNSETVGSKSTFNYEDARKTIENFNSSVNDVRPKKAINMSQFAKNVESDLERFQNVKTYNYNEPFPVNYSKHLIPVNKPVQKIEHMANTNSKPIEEIKQEKKVDKNIEESKEDKLFKIFNEYRDIIMFVLFFILLNNKFIIELIYNRVPYIKNLDSPYPNLIIRALIFGFLLWGIKKFNL